LARLIGVEVMAGYRSESEFDRCCGQETKQGPRGPTV